MCIGSSPSMPAPAAVVAPPPLQEAKAPDATQASYKKRATAGAAQAGVTAGTLMTGTGGIAPTSLSTGKTLLGQ